jgi:hypothetical protein
MGWCAPGVAGVADVADDLAAANKTTLSERPESLEVCKVVDLGPRAEDFDDIATKPVPANVEDDTRNRGDDLSAALGEDVNALVSPAAAARSTPGICECFGRYPTNRDGQGGGGWQCREGEENTWLRHDQENPDHSDSDQDKACEESPTFHWSPNAMLRGALQRVRSH